jgi:DNA-binding transcriptional ArsR family regulator
MRERGLKADDGRLGADLLATLEPGFQDALNHPTRRDILRAIHDDGRPCAVGEIVADLDPLKRGEVAYHARVLKDAECIEAVGARPAPGGEEPVLASLVAASEEVLAVLRSTRYSDRNLRLRTPADRSPGVMAMFRLPRPAYSIRLLNRRRRPSEG